MCWLHHSPFPNKITCLVSYLSLFFHIPYLDKDQASLLPTSMECMKWFQRSLSGNPKINPLFLPTTKPHRLNTLTRGPPPIYWLGTSKWCLVHAPLCLSSFLSNLHNIYVAFVFVWFCCMFWLVFYLLWREGCVGFWAHVPCLSSFPWTGHCLGEGPHLLAEPMFFLSCVRRPLGC